MKMEKVPILQEGKKFCSWFVPRHSDIAHLHIGYKKCTGKCTGIIFWCGITKDNYEVRMPKDTDIQCPHCLELMRQYKRKFRVMMKKTLSGI